jgi:hypothetical protein
MAEAHPQRYVGSIGNSARTAWFIANSSVLFQPNGPLGLYNPKQSSMLMPHFGVAQHQTKEKYNEQHSKEQSGTGEEEILA